MSMTQWWIVATILLVAGATASGVEWLGPGSGPETQIPAARQDKAVARDAPTREVRRGKLELARSSRGSVEALRAPAVYCNVEGGTTIIKILPEGRRVKKGDVVAELDSASLKDQLVNQRIKFFGAQANYLNAKLTREVAEIALKEYVEGVFKQDMETLERAIEGGRATIRKIEERLERTRKASERLKEAIGPAVRARTPSDIVAEVDILDRIEEAELSRDRERRALAQAEGRREVLERYTRGKTIKELESEIKKAQADELARQAAWELEKSKAEKLEKQIASCTLIAPIDGVVIYADDPDVVRRGGYRIQEGATVRERQIIVHVLDTNGPMQINLKVPEAWVDQLAANMKARVKVDAFADQTLDGLVTEIAPLPDPGTFFNQNIKVYTTRIQIGRRLAGLRPGMTAEAEIVVAERDEAIGVPVGAVVLYDGKYHVALNQPDGHVEWRDVVLGAGDDKTVEVKEGLREGDQVILDPAPYLSDEQRAKINAAPARVRKKAAASAKKKA
jgi:RND family efflux transporter MFP subunit